MGSQSVSEQYTHFGLKLFRAIAQREPDKNIFVSPLSIAIALAVLYNGAAGETRAEIANLLELRGLNLENVNSANAAMLKQLHQLDPQVALTMTSRLEVGSDMAVIPSFRQVIQQFYEIDAIEPGAGGTIVIANKIHFKGNWTTPFEDGRRRLPFTLANGIQKPCDLMSSPKQDWAYYRHDRFEMVRLPYGTGRTSLYILLPAQKTKLAEVVADLLTPGNWTSWLGKLAEKEGEIEMPAFEIKYDVILNEILKALGMSGAFDPGRAHFEPLCALPTYVDQVSHQAQIEVDEQGTEASAETKIAVVLAGFMPERTFRMRLNRPFLYTIQDDQTGALLFLGQFVDPAPSAALTWEQEQQLAFPDSLELLAVLLEADASLEHAMGEVYTKFDHDLAIEFGRVLQEIQLGRPLIEALTRLGERVANPDFSLFVDDLIQAMQTGKSQLEVVRSHAQRVRQKFPRP